MKAETGLDRFLYTYSAYPHQKAFHESPAKHRLLGGAAGPGKTLALIIDQMATCNGFSKDVAPQVHTLLLRRTHPKLEATVITRFREKIPRELYADYNEQKHMVTWKNGATTTFASMQYEHDVWGMQGQYLAIGYDELTEFTFNQWQNISAWNRCPVSTKATKDGATNPIGIGARWCEDVFIKKQPCAEMDSNQKSMYRPQDYAYFAATYLDNPIYAQDQQYIDALDSYQGPIAQALKHGIWGVAGGYFDGAWDEAVNVYGPFEIPSWWKKWLGGDWGFDHNSAIHWFCEDEFGVVRIYRELIVNKHTGEDLARKICYMSKGEEYKGFWFSHDAFSERQEINTVGLRMGAAMREFGQIAPVTSTKDKKGREQILYDYLKKRITVGQDADKNPIIVPKLQIAGPVIDSNGNPIPGTGCPNLIRTIGIAPRDEKKSEEIAEFLGDDALQSSGYGLYGMYGKPNKKPAELVLRERAMQVEDPVARHFFVLEQQKRMKEQTDSWQPKEVPPWMGQ